MDISPTTYADARAALAQVSRRKIAPNTWLEAVDAYTIGITLYATRIVTFHSGGTITLDNDGHVTSLTAERINRYLPKGFRVHRKLGGMLLNGPDFTNRLIDGTWSFDPNPVAAFREQL